MNEIFNETAPDQAESAIDSARIDYGVLFGYDQSEYRDEYNELIVYLHQDGTSDEEFVRTIRSFPASKHQEIAEEVLFDSYRADYLFRNLNFFYNLDLRKIVDILLEGILGDGFGGGVEVDNFETYFFRYLDKFEDVITHQEIVDKFLESEECYLLAQYLDRFKDVDHEVISQIIFEKAPWTAKRHKRNLKGLPLDWDVKSSNEELGLAD